MRHTIVIGQGRGARWPGALPLVLALLTLATASAQTPPPGSGARIPPTGSTPPGGESEPGKRGPEQPPGVPGPAKDKPRERKDASNERDAIAAARRLAPLQWFYVQHLGAGPAVEPAYDQNFFFIALKGNQLGAWSNFTGTPGWTVPNVTATQPLVSDSGRVYVVGDGDLTAIEAASGKALWRVPTGAAVSARPAAKAGWLILALETGEVRAVRGETGETLWQQTFRAAIKTALVIVGDRLYVAPQDNRLVALDLLSGQQLWAQDFGAFVTAVAADGHRVLAGTSRMFAALNHAGHVEWKWRVGAEVIGRPALDESTVYVAFTDNTMRAFAVENGAMRWRTPLDYRPIAGPAVYAGTLVLAGIAPVLHAYDTKEGKLVQDLPIPVDPRSIIAASVHIAPGTPYFYDSALVLLAQGHMAGARRQGPGPIAPFTDLGVVCPPLALPREPPTPTAAAPPKI